MTLGRADDSLSTKLSEPISVTLKSGHGGLGMSSHLREIASTSTSHHTSEQSYRSTAAQKRLESLLLSDLHRARKSLQSLDEAHSLPRTPFWPLEPKRKLLEDDYSFSSVKADVLSNREAYYKEIATDEELEEGIEAEGVGQEEAESAFEQLETLEKLTQVTTHLRTTYFYCVWCADKFSSREEMESLCP
ncbi:hypothetical protein HDU98_006066, partial [Podochytrium sp. JEL0797]